MNLFRKRKAPEESPPAFHVRWMLGSDLPAVQEIEQLAFREPWSRSEMEKVLKSTNVVAVVVGDVRANRVAGYAIYEAAKRQIELLDFAVLPACQRRGVGRLMLDTLKRKLTPGRSQIVLTIGDGNLDGQLFFKAQGFRAEAVIRRAFVTSDEDGYRMRYRAGMQP